jgi:Putative  PD-(D/E)XK family member, (DUF4420)
MTSDELKSKWSTLEALPRQGDYDLLLVSEECRANLSVAITPEGYRALILRLPENYEADFLEVKKENLSLITVPGYNYVGVVLRAQDFVDLFDDLVTSMHNAIREMECVDDYFGAFKSTFVKWSHFFEARRTSRLTDKIVRGLFGELVFLRKLLSEAHASEVNNILEAWRGPYDRGHDFVFDDKSIEIKTCSIGNRSVRIANEDQLAQPEGKGLELAVISLDTNAVGGETLSELARSTLTLIERSLGDASIFYTALAQKDLGDHNLDEYDHIRLRAHDLGRYDCLRSQFPRLIKQSLPEPVFEVRYSLNLTTLDEFLIERVEL